MADLTAIILTKNEELNIEACLRSVAPVAKRILVIDSFSTDRTVEIVEQTAACLREAAERSEKTTTVSDLAGKGAPQIEIHQHPFENYARQFLYGLNSFDIQTRWVLRIDADERLTEASAVELEQLCEENMDTDVNGIVLRFEVSFLGRKLRHGGIYPFRKLLVFKYGIGTIEDRNMDEHIVLSGGRTVEAKQDCEHHDFKDLTFWTNKHNWYASREVLDYLDNRDKGQAGGASGVRGRVGIKSFIKFRIYYKLPMGMRAHLYYIYRYYFRLGFLDGREGKIYAFLQAYWYRFLVDAKIYEQQKKEEQICRKS